MKFKSQLLATASGSTAGCTYSHNRYGAYIRNRSIPVNTNTIDQQARRGVFASLSTAWGSLTQAQRDAWNAYAAIVPRTDAFGDPQFVTGQNWYIATNSIRSIFGGARIDVAPIILQMATLTPPSFTIVASTGIATVAFTNTDIWATAVLGSLLGFSSRGQPPSRTFFKGPFRFRSRIAGAVTPPTSPQTMVVGNSFAVAVGQRVFIRFVAINADNRISTAVIASAIAT